MAKRITMPKLGQTVEESTIIQWLKKEGDEVQKGDILLEIETDKANMEVESFVEGTLLKILRHEGESVPVMEVIAYVGEPGESVPEPPPAANVAATVPPQISPGVELSERPVKKRREAGGKTEVFSRVPSAQRSPHDLPEPSRVESAVFRISPRAAKLARESVIDARHITGSGPAGRVIEKDVKEYLEEHDYHRIRITPAARRLASEHDLDLLQVYPDEPGGKITTSDIQRILAERPQPLSRIRQVIAERLTKSFTTTPHFYVTVLVDVTDLLELRSRRKDEGKEFTLTDLILKAVALTLREFPMVNSSTADGRLFRRRSGIHLGLAVAVDEGLLVPVIHHADRLTLDGLHQQAEDLVKRARMGKLAPDEMKGSTFTVSNMGMLDVENFAAIINPGESAILAVSSVRKTPVVREERIVVRSMMKMTLSADHRLVDGALAARFINAVKTKLEDQSLWESLT